MRSRLILSLAFGMVAASGGPALAGGIYKFVEKDGTIVYTNVAPGKEKRARRLKGTFTPAPRLTDAPPRKVLTPATYASLVEEAAKRYKIPQALVLAVMHAESAFNQNAVSSAGACGLMQLMPKTAEQMFVKDIFDARENIEGGARYLRVLANEFDGDMVKMVAAYNAGPEAVRKYGGKIPPYAETQAYVRKVLKLYYEYKNDLAKADATAEKG